MKGLGTGVTLLAFALFIVFIGPAFSILALNTLFDTGIELGVGTWFAMFWIHVVAFGSVTTKKG